MFWFVCVLFNNLTDNCPKKNETRERARPWNQADSEKNEAFWRWVKFRAGQSGLISGSASGFQAWKHRQWLGQLKSAALSSSRCFGLNKWMFSIGKWCFESLYLPPAGKLLSCPFNWLLLLLLLFDDEFVLDVLVLPLVDVLLLLMKSLKSVDEVVVLVLLSYSWSLFDAFSQSGGTI